MAVRITHVRFESTTRREDGIVSYKWQNGDGQVGESNKRAMVEYLEAKNRVYVADGQTSVEVGIVRPSDGEPYLRTYADEKWTNNLVNLPTF